MYDHEIVMIVVQSKLWEEFGTLEIEPYNLGKNANYGQ